MKIPSRLLHLSSGLAVIIGLSLASTATAGWDQKADMLFPRGEHANVVHNGKIYVLGGISNHSTGPAQMEVYNPADNTWTQEGSLPANRYRHHFTAGSSLYNGPRGPEIWICGGKAGSANQGTVFVDVYNIQTQTWSRGPDLPENHWAGPAVLVGDNLHVLTGGRGKSSAENHHFVLNLSTVTLNPSGAGTGWTNAAPVPQKRVHVAGVNLNGKIYLIGGEFDHNHDLTGDTPTVQVYDPATDTWNPTSENAAANPPLADLPAGAGRSHHEWATFVHNGRILVVGGVDGVKEVAGSNYKVPITRKSIFEYNPSNNTWTELLELPRSLASPGAKIVGNTLYVFGGGENDWFGGDLATTWAIPYAELTGGTQNPVPPVANAGPDISVTDNNGNGNENVTLNGSGSSDSDGTIVSYRWLVNGSQVATGVSPSVSFQVGVRNVTLEVTDNSGLVGTDVVSVAVNAGGGTSIDVDVITEAELYDQANGIGTAQLGSGQKLVNIHDGEWVLYSQFDFGSSTTPDAESVEISVSSNTTGGIIRFRLGNPTTGTTIATIDFSGSGGWNNWVTLSTGLIAPVSGLQELYVTFEAHPGETRSLMDIDWFQFKSDPQGPVNPGPGTDIFAEDFASGTNFSNTSAFSLGGNGVASYQTPSSGATTAKDSLSNFSGGTVDLDGATSVTLGTLVRLVGPEVGDLEIHMIVRFVNSNNNTTDVAADRMSISNSFNGNFLPYEKTIAVPAGSDRITDVRIRMDQNQPSSSQTVYFDDVTITGD